MNPTRVIGTCVFNGKEKPLTLHGCACECWLYIPEWPPRWWRIALFSFHHLSLRGPSVDNTEIKTSARCSINMVQDSTDQGIQVHYILATCVRGYTQLSFHRYGGNKTIFRIPSSHVIYIVFLNRLKQWFSNCEPCLYLEAPYRIKALMWSCAPSLSRSRKLLTEIFGNH